MAVVVRQAGGDAKPRGSEHPLFDQFRRRPGGSGTLGRVTGEAVGQRDDRARVNQRPLRVQGATSTVPSRGCGRSFHQNHV